MPWLIPTLAGIVAIPLAGWVGWALGSIYSIDKYRSHLIQQGKLHYNKLTGDWE